MNEVNSSHQISSEIIEHACDDSSMDLYHTEEEVDVTYINYTNETNKISMNDDANVSINTMHLYYCQITTNTYPQEQNRIQKNAGFFVIKILFLIYD